VGSFGVAINQREGQYMTKGELVDAVKGERTKKETEAVVEALFDALTRTLIKEGRFAYPGFGVFIVKTRAARTGKDPIHKKPIKIPASKTVVFRPAARLKESL